MTAQFPPLEAAGSSQPGSPVARRSLPGWPSEFEGFVRALARQAEAADYKRPSDNLAKGR